MAHMTMKEMPAKGMGKMAAPRGKINYKMNGAMGMENYGESIRLNMNDYPELEGYEKGREISGSFSGTVTAADGKMVTIQFDNLDLKTDNEADRFIERQTGKKNRMGRDMMNYEEEE